MASRSPEGVPITGVFGSGKSSVAAEIGYELEQRGELYALLDLDFLGWVGDHDTGRATMLRNLASGMAGCTLTSEQRTCQPDRNGASWSGGIATAVWAEPGPDAWRSGEGGDAGGGPLELPGF